jgi:hypothetical protein
LPKEGWTETVLEMDIYQPISKTFSQNLCFWSPNNLLHCAEKFSSEKDAELFFDFSVNE